MGTTAIVLVILAFLSLIAVVIGLIKNSRLDPAIRQKRTAGEASPLPQRVKELFNQIGIPALTGIYPAESIPPEDGTFTIGGGEGYFYYRGILIGLLARGVVVRVAPSPDTPLPQKSDTLDWFICHKGGVSVPGPWDMAIEEALEVWEIKAKDVCERRSQMQMVEQQAKQTQEKAAAEKFEALKRTWARPHGSICATPFRVDTVPPHDLPKGSNKENE